MAEKPLLEQEWPQVAGNITLDGAHHIDQQLQLLVGLGLNLPLSRHIDCRGRYCDAQQVQQKQGEVKPAGNASAR